MSNQTKPSPASAKPSNATAVTASISEQEMEAARKVLRKVHFWMFKEFPFWAFLIEKCTIHLVPPNHPEVDTACITGDGKIYFNYGYWQKLDQRGKAFLMSHEVMHLVLEHHRRMHSRDPEDWNVAGDVLINHMIAGHFGGRAAIGNILDDACVPEKYLDSGVDVDTLNTEQVYEAVKRKRKPPEGGGGRYGNGGGGIGQDLAGQAPDGSQVLKEQTEATPDAKDGGWVEAAAQAATRARMQGKLPASIERIVGELMQPEVSWDQALAFAMRSRLCQKGKGKSTFLPPNRRYLWRDIVLPSRRAGKVPGVAFSIDTSGSMSQEDITKGLSEFDAVRKLYGLPTYLIECDAAVSSAKWIGAYEPIPKLTGGGGTSFIPVMDHISKMDNRPDVLVYFTDGWGEFGSPPDFDVIWVINTEVVAPYGTTIHVKGK